MAKKKPVNNKKKLVVSYENLSPELLEAFKLRYPQGYQDEVIKVDKPNGTCFYAVTLDTEDAVYLVKVNVKVDTKIKDEDEEKNFFNSLNDLGSEETTPPDDLNDDDDDDQEDNRGFKTTSLDDLGDDI